MPRIRRYHPVSHEFNRDREVQELRRRFADWMGYVWLEMLSEADRNEGEIRGDREAVATSMCWVSLSNRPTYSRVPILNAIQYMIDKGWVIEGTGCLLVRNYPKYHRHREQNPAPLGNKSGSPPNQTRPDLTRPKVLSTVAGGQPPADPPAQAPISWEGFADVQKVLTDLQVDDGLNDPAYWKRIDAWIESTGLSIYYLDELKAYIAWWHTQPGPKKHKDLQRGFRKWLATAKRIAENNAQREAVKRSR